MFKGNEGTRHTLQIVEPFEITISRTMEVLQASHTPIMFAGQSQKPLLTLAQKQALIDNLQLEGENIFR